MLPWFAPAHIALSAIILAWDVVLAGRIAQFRETPRLHAVISGLIALLLVPAVMIALATTTIITGRAVAGVEWIWPAMLVLVATQATYALIRRLVNPAWGIPIVVYDVLLAIVGVARYWAAQGYDLPQALVALLGAHSIAMTVAVTPAALATPIYLNMPIVSPAFPALRGVMGSLRVAFAALAVIWVAVAALLGLPRAIEANRSHERLADARLRERPAGDFAVGLKILPDAGSPPSAAVVRNDLALADSLGVTALLVVVVPDANRLTIDSVARVLEPMHRAGTTLIVAMGYRGGIIPELGRTALDEEQRIAAIQRIVTRLQPAILLPAEDPYGTGARVVGWLPAERWQNYLTRAAAAAKAVDPNVRVGVSMAAFGARDSALYAWAVSPGSPIEVVGFSFFPGRAGSADIEAAERAADRWMHAHPPEKEHWVFAAGGFPLAYGELSQERAIWQALAWATERPAFKGLVVYEAGDYGHSRGLRAPNGRLRRAAGAVSRAVIGLREAVEIEP